jgi:thioesterase domain-containing protein
LVGVGDELQGAIVGVAPLADDLFIGQLMAAGEKVPIVVVLDGIARASFVELFAGAPAAERARRSREAAAATSEQSRIIDLMELYRTAVRRYVPKRFPGRIAVLRSAGVRVMRSDLGWQALAAQVETHSIPGGHLASLTHHVAATGACVKACLDAASSTSR